MWLFLLLLLISTCYCRFCCFVSCWAWFSGYFSGQTGYGYRSFEAFIDAVRQIEAGSATAEVKSQGSARNNLFFRKQAPFCFWETKTRSGYEISLLEIKTPRWKTKFRFGKTNSVFEKPDPVLKNHIPCGKTITCFRETKLRFGQKLEVAGVDTHSPI